MSYYRFFEFIKKACQGVRITVNFLQDNISTEVKQFYEQSDLRLFLVKLRD